VGSGGSHGDDVDADSVQLVTSVAQLREIASAGDSTVVAKALDKETTAEEILEPDTAAIGGAEGDGREAVAHFEHAVAPLVTRCLASLAPPTFQSGRTLWRQATSR